MNENPIAEDAIILKVTPTESSGFLPAQKRELLFAKSSNDIADKMIAYCGAFAGFEGFIINAYAGSSTTLSTSLQIGYFLIFLSLFGNIMTASLSLLVSGLIRSGVALGEYWWIRYVMRICVLTCLFSTILYAVSFQLYVADSPINMGFKIAIWVISCFLVSVVVCVFALTFRKSHLVKDEESEKIIEFFG